MPTVLYRSVALGAATLMLVAGCTGGGDPDPIPPPSSSTETTNPGPAVSPAPAAPKLDAEQKASYDLAVQRYTDFEAFASRAFKDPAGADKAKVAAELSTYTIMPGTKKWADSFDQLIADGIRIDGKSSVEWTVPVRVTDNTVVFKQCQGPGTWTAYQGEEKTKQDNNILSEVTTVKVDDDWRIKDQDFGEC